VTPFKTIPITIPTQYTNTIFFYPGTSYPNNISSSFNAYVTSYNASTGYINLGNIHGLNGAFASPTIYNLKINRCNSN
jgi:hypothetical protein